MLGDLEFDGQGGIIRMNRIDRTNLEFQCYAVGNYKDGDYFHNDLINTSEFRADGTSFLKLKGQIVMESGAVIQLEGVANGMRNPDGSQTFRGGFYSTSPPGKFQDLNAMAHLFELDVDTEHVFKIKVWEWK